MRSFPSCRADDPAYCEAARKRHHAPLQDDDGIHRLTLRCMLKSTRVGARLGLQPACSTCARTKLLQMITTIEDWRLLIRGPGSSCLCWPANCLAHSREHMGGDIWPRPIAWAGQSWLSDRERNDADLSATVFRRSPMAAGVLNLIRCRRKHWNNSYNPPVSNDEIVARHCLRVVS